MKAKITEYKGKLVCDLLVEQSDAAPGSFGQVIIDTPNCLGVSKEAIALLETIRPGSDAIGAVDWFESTQGLVFAWIGGPKSVVDPSEDGGRIGARGYHVPSGGYIDIPNESDPGAKEYIDSM